MANNYLQFSEVVTNLTPKEVAWLKEYLERMRALCEIAQEGDHEHPISREDRALIEELDLENWGFGFDWKIDKDPEWGDHLWIYTEESGDPHQVAVLVRRFLRKFRPDDCFILSYAETCSKPRVGEFSGGAFFVTAENIRSISAGDWAARLKRKQDEKKKKP